MKKFPRLVRYMGRNITVNLPGKGNVYTTEYRDKIKTKDIFVIFSEYMNWAQYKFYICLPMKCLILGKTPMTALKWKNNNKFLHLQERDFIEIT